MRDLVQKNKVGVSHIRTTIVTTVLVTLVVDDNIAMFPILLCLTIFVSFIRLEKKF